MTLKTTLPRRATYAPMTLVDRGHAELVRMVTLAGVIVVLFSALAALTLVVFL